jgi:hypothetical protein
MADDKLPCRRPESIDATSSEARGLAAYRNILEGLPECLLDADARSVSGDHHRAFDDA